MSAPGDLVDGRFELLRRLGSGGMGTVWRARDTVLHREVALKEVRYDAGPAGATRERVLREARALARLSHPHVVTVHHIVDVEPHPWIVMELLPGPSLQDRIAQEGPLSPVEAARTGRQVLAALRAAHTAGIRHRDVKPANILLRADGNAVLTDFGIAALQGSTSLTMTGELVGSPEYMAPERIRGMGDDPASDLWSLGLVLYVCVEGVSPLRRATTLATLAAVLDDPVPPAVRSGPLAPVLTALLVRDPAARPDANRLDEMLALAESGTAPPPHWPAQPTVTAPPRATPPPGPVPPGPLPAPATRPGLPARSRTPVVVAALSVAVALVAATALVLVLRGGPDTNAGGHRGPAASPTATAPPTTAGPTASAPTTAPTTAAPTTTVPTTAVPTTYRPTQAPPPPATPSDPLAESWIAQLASVSKSSGTGARARMAASLRDKGLEEADYLDSDAYASLRPGYWVFYVPGFNSGTEAAQWCRSAGLTSRNDCLGRYLSHRASDFGYQCAPGPGAVSGRCTRA
ncbi:serine/threonine protein kinase [Streptomyces sp. WAC05374]|uniref:serine/threonine-protein kinase n=2 Tax=Streptomyces sp. WAC05374 TaxID=2487420 RepID=UPI001056B1C7|nr:serine/threonine-protein kinase [Streptomyces sp. WAC05374]TDF48500.1 serine/threonine protein kinase [Streptomyces sp. WAC05374]TDF54944.1 serine/threonine protein kinase [Streptomyces sp. WAC05374]TDF55434.1 serine/threonine protein kinase [Streptomyces sp. WAC05374]